MQGRLSSLGPLILLGVAVLVSAGVSAQVLYLAQDSVPLADEWLYTNDDTLLTQLFAAHREHRLVIGRILMWLDAALFRSNGFALKALSLLLLLGLAALLARMAWETGARGRSLAALSLIGAVYALTPLQYQNFIWAFQPPFVMSVLAAGGAFLSYARRTEQGWPVAPSLLAILSFLSLSNGLLVAPLLAFVAAHDRRWRDAGCFAFVAVALLSAHFLTPHAAAASAHGLDSLAGFFEFFLALLGTPLIQIYDAASSAGADDPLRRIILSASGLAVAALTVVAVFKHRNTKNVGVKALSLFALFILTTCAVIALGRFGYGMVYAGSSRYVTYSVALYASLFLLYVRNWQAAPGTYKIAAAQISVAVFLLAFACASTTVLNWVYHGQSMRMLARAALVTRVADDEALAAIGFGAPGVTRRRAEHLRADKRGFFAERWATMIDRRLPANMRSLPECQAQMRNIQFEPRGRNWRAQGAIVDEAPFRNGDTLLLINQRGHIAGYARMLHRPIPPLRPLAGASDAREWVGYYRGAFPATPVIASENALLCRLPPIRASRGT
jgi:hypothetical protein